MSTPQQPVGSGFGARTTATEVLDGLDLGGRLAIVTGGYSGLGLEIVRALAGAGAHVIVPARRREHAERELAGIDGVEVGELDLGDPDSIHAFAHGILGSDRAVDHLIGNAGVMACPEGRVGPGWETQFGTNHLGHFALVGRLWPALVADGGARVISVSSRGHKFSGIRFDDVEFERGYDKWQAYGQSKTANALFALELDRLGVAHGVRAFSLHPGGIMTPLQRHLTREEFVENGWMDEEGNLSDRFKTPEQGAATATWAATSPALDGLGGVYLEDCDVAVPSGDLEDPTAGGVDDHATDPDAARRLWALSVRRTGIDALATA